MRFSLLFSSLVSVSLSAHPGFHKIASFKEVDKITGMLPVDDTWYVFDLDNTVITPDTKNGPERTIEATDGFYYRNKARLYLDFSEKNDQQTAKELSYRQSVDEWNAIVKSGVPFKLLEEGMDSWLKQKISQGYYAMGHTAREADLIETTVSQLSRVGVFFSGQKIEVNVFLPPKNPLHPEEGIFKDGIFLVGRGGTKTKNHKGKRFLELLHEFKLHGISAPKNVVFLDDREEHTTGIIEELSRAGINVYGFHLVNIEAEADH